METKPKLIIKNDENCKDNSYKGFIVEYEGHGLSEKDGILATKKLIKRFIPNQTNEFY